MTYVETERSALPKLEEDDLQAWPATRNADSHRKNGITGDVSGDRDVPLGQAAAPQGAEVAPHSGAAAHTPTAGLEFTAAVMQATRYEVRGDSSVLYHVYDKPAYIDHGPQLLMCAGASDVEASVVGALLHAREKFGGKIELTGSDEFKAFALQMLVKHNVAVTLKNPEQHAQLQELRNAAARANATQSAADGITGGLADKPTEVQSAAAVKQEGRQEGVLIAHGEAPYNNEKDGRPSYFATLRQADGSETTVWGVDLPRALEAVNAREGDTVSLATVGRKPVEVTFNERQPDGTMQSVTKQALRNEWEAKVLATWEAKVTPTDAAQVTSTQPGSQTDASQVSQAAEAPKARRATRRR